MRSFAFINASKLTEGTFVSSFKLFRELSSAGFPINWYQCVDVGRKENYLTNEHTIKGSSFPGGVLSMGFNRLLLFPRGIRRIRDDFIVFSDPTLLGFMKPTSRMIVILHDIRPLTEYKDRLSTHLLYRYILPRLKQVGLIIVPTQHLQQMLLARGFEADQIAVIPLTTDVSFKPSDHINNSVENLRAKSELRILYVSSDRPYKNVSFFIKLAERMQNEKGPISFRFILVCKLRRKTEQEIASRELNNLHLLGNVENIWKAYSDADVLAFPSMFEGFGLPIIEAMSLGMPVIVNDLSPMRDLVGKREMSLPPNDLNAWSMTLRRLSGVEEYVSEANIALNRARMFSEKEYSLRVRQTFDGFAHKTVS